MDNTFTSAGSFSSVSRRRVRSKASEKFSPSFGVHRGLIKDPNWPPAAMPEGGSAASRRFRRVEAKFDVELRGESVTVVGDISQGGAMFLLSRKVETKVVDIVVQGRAARAEILSTSQKGDLFAHHCRFLDSSESLPVWHTIAKS